MISGRRRAPGTLGNLYPRLEAVQLGIGSYESVGASPSEPGPAEQALIGVVQVAAAAGPYCRWAERSGDSGFSEQPSANRLLYVLNDQQLTASERMIGEPPAYLAVLTDKPGTSDQIATAFADSRYFWVKTEAVYNIGDQGRQPKMVFLHWAELRPMNDWKGRSASAQLAATRLGGTLVFPVVVPTSPGDRERPQDPFADALKTQFPGSTGVIAPQVVSHPGDADPAAMVSIARQESAKNTLLLLGILALAGTAAYAGYKLTHALQKAPA